MKKIPLKRARIVWNNGGGVKVEDINEPTDNRYMCSNGACCAGWNKGSKGERVGRLYRLAFHMITCYSVPVRQIQQEFLNIKEYADCEGEGIYFLP